MSVGTRAVKHHKCTDSMHWNVHSYNNYYRCFWTTQRFMEVIKEYFCRWLTSIWAGVGLQTRKSNAPTWRPLRLYFSDSALDFSHSELYPAIPSEEHYKFSRFVLLLRTASGIFSSQLKVIMLTDVVANAQQCIGQLMTQAKPQSVTTSLIQQ